MLMYQCSYLFYLDDMKLSKSYHHRLDISYYAQTSNPLTLLTLQYASKAIFPRTKITLVVFSSIFVSARRYREQLDISDVSGLFSAGTHRTRCSQIGIL